PDSKRGLILPRGWDAGRDPLLVVEGPSDVLALAALGLPSVGRPSNTGGGKLLVKLLAGTERPVIVVGEWDSKPDGQWPGRDGAVKVSADLVAKLAGPVSWALPPKGSKDVRDWALSIAAAGDWTVAGLKLAEHFAAATNPVKFEGAGADQAEAA